MSNKSLLVITASNGENLKLAERFINLATNKNQSTSLIDLTTLDLPLYNPRTHSEKGIPTAAIELMHQMKSYSKWVICAPEYNGSIPPVLSSAIAWLSIQGDDFRKLFNERPIAIATYSGGGGMELLLSLRIQLTHLGAQVIGRQLLSNSTKHASDEVIHDLLQRLLQLNTEYA